MSNLFDRDKSTISRHIRNIYEEGELLPDSTVAKYATVQTEGKREVTNKQSKRRIKNIENIRSVH